MLEQKLKAELNKIANSQLGQVLSEQLKTYEKKLKDIVSDLNVRGKDARSKSKKQLEQIAGQLKNSRGDFERKVLATLNKEAKRLNKNVQDPFQYIEKLTEEKSEVREALKTKAKSLPKKKISLKKSSSKTHKSNSGMSRTSASNEAPLQ